MFSRLFLPYFITSLLLLFLYDFFVNPSMRIFSLRPLTAISKLPGHLDQLGHHLHNPLPAGRPLNIMSSPSALPPPKEVLDFWLAPVTDSPDKGPDQILMKWFRGPPELDEKIRSKFGLLVAAARAEPPTLPLSWGSCLSSAFVGKDSAPAPTDEASADEQARTTLALLLLLDQFPRNIYRNSGAAFASDLKGQKVAVYALEQKLDERVPLAQRMFFYMPLMHAEDLDLQLQGVAAMEKWSEVCKRELDAATQRGERTEKVESALKQAQMSTEFAKGHAKTVEVLGRFPGRNKALGRESTEEEIKFLEEHPSGFFLTGRK